MSATSGSPFSIRYTTQPAEVSRLVITTLGSQARLRLQKLGHHRPNETAGSVLVFFHTDDSGIGKFHRTAIRTTGQQERSQTLEVWKMAHNENVIRIDFQDNSGRIWCARTSIACIIEPSVSSSSTLVL